MVERWWATFASPQLDDTVEQAISGSPTLDAARATLAQAQQAILAARGGLYPQADIAASGECARTGVVGGAGTHAVSNLLAVGLTVSYDFDLFGRASRHNVRRNIADCRLNSFDVV